ncbi:DUF6191 domain-containing protein [Xylanimonas cellulosilytica]|uniref:DUF6191 domain-containing protein n=1 Tax=Xylanimonas cellulosilytica TaxID=186189 RepID=UPI003CCAEB5F
MVRAGSRSVRPDGVRTPDPTGPRPARAPHLTCKDAGHAPVSPLPGNFAGALLGDLVDAFQPSRHHLTEERERQRLDTAQRPLTADSNGEIDLDSGVVIVSVDPRA